MHALIVMKKIVALKVDYYQFEIATGNFLKRGYKI